MSEKIGDCQEENKNIICITTEESSVNDSTNRQHNFSSATEGDHPEKLNRFSLDYMSKVEK